MSGCLAAPTNRTLQVRSAAGGSTSFRSGCAPDRCSRSSVASALLQRLARRMLSGEGFSAYGWCTSAAPELAPALLARRRLPPPPPSVQSSDLRRMSPASHSCGCCCWLKRGGCRAECCDGVRDTAGGGGERTDRGLEGAMLQASSSAAALSISLITSITLGTATFLCPEPPRSTVGAITLPPCRTEHIREACRMGWGVMPELARVLANDTWLGTGQGGDAHPRPRSNEGLHILMKRRLECGRQRHAPGRRRAADAPAVPALRRGPPT